MHSVERLFATLIRNSGIKNDVLYFGPMGCQTGYCLFARNACHDGVIAAVKETLEQIITYDGPMLGKSEIECGNL